VEPVLPVLPVLLERGVAARMSWLAVPVSHWPIPPGPLTLAIYTPLAGNRVPFVCILTITFVNIVMDSLGMGRDKL
jgi:hypothetical protein